MEFMQATKGKYRFESCKGVLSVEDLWDLPLSNLDDVAKTLNRQIKEDAGESFIETATTNPITIGKFEVVKAIIKERLDANEKHRTSLERKGKKEKIMNILAAKRDESLHQATEEELKDMLKDL